MLKRVKRASLGIFKAGGVFRAVEASGWRGRRLVVLAYLGVSLEDEHEWDPASYLSPRHFEERLAILKRTRCTVLPLHEAVERLYRGDLPPRSLALTFDGGNYDFFSRVWPMLESYGYPATVFLTTYYCDFNRPIFDVACSYLLWKASTRRSEIPGEPLGLTQNLDLRTERSRSCAKDLLIAVSREWRLDGEDKDHLLERLADAGEADYGSLRRKRKLHLLAPEEVGRLAAAGIDFQLHTHRHRAPLDRALFLKEIQDNRERIRTLAGTDPDFFSYPDGSIRPEFLPWLPEAGVRFAVTCRPGAVTVDSHHLLLPRFADSGNLSPVEFESIVTGFASWMPHGRNRSGVPCALSRLHASHGL
ncbi:MAG TPA: polysaccharide deacetylase family protein [Bryobacteraceae bacterium]|nr:polysaccharide deacetylase family protein [Bryobacteraceae bacterium]